MLRFNERVDFIPTDTQMGFSVGGFDIAVRVRELLPRYPGRWETAGYSTQDLCKRLVRFVNSGAAVALSVFTSPRAFAQLYKYPINSYLKYKNPILRTSRDKKRGRAELHTELRTRLRTGTVTEPHATYGEVSGRY